MKISLSESTCPGDALNEAMAVIASQRFLLAEINRPTEGMGMDEAHGQIVLYRLLESLIMAAMEKQDAINATKLKAVNA